MKFLRNELGHSAVEFALILPTLLVIYIGGFEFMQAASIYSKISHLTTTLASILSRDTIETPADIDAENQAATQVMTPIDIAPLTTVSIEITTDKVTPGKGLVIWSRSNRNSSLSPCIRYPSNTGCPIGAQTPYPVNTVLTSLPVNLAANTTYLVVQTYYNYQVTVGSQIINPIPMLSDQLFYLPRTTSSIACPTCS